MQAGTSASMAAYTRLSGCIYNIYTHMVPNIRSCLVGEVPSELCVVGSGTCHYSQAPCVAPGGAGPTQQGDRQGVQCSAVRAQGDRLGSPGLVSHLGVVRLGARFRPVSLPSRPQYMYIPPLLPPSARPMGNEKSLRSMIARALCTAVSLCCAPRVGSGVAWPGRVGDWRPRIWLPGLQHHLSGELRG
jgi:hypothetical protein